MTNLLPSVLSAAQLQIMIGQMQLAYAQSLSFTHDMTNVPVGGIGSINNHALEPVRYLARGTLVITQYSDTVLSRITNKGTAKDKAPANMANTSSSQAVSQLADGKSDLTKALQSGFDGNSMLRSPFFNPVTLLLSGTFDIDVYEREIGPNGFDTSTGVLLYTIAGCRMNNYSMRFNPGTLLNETVSFLAMQVIDRRYTLA